MRGPELWIMNADGSSPHKLHPAGEWPGLRSRSASTSFRRGPASRRATSWGTCRREASRRQSRRQRPSPPERSKTGSTRPGGLASSVTILYSMLFYQQLGTAPRKREWCARARLKSGTGLLF
jgi:hypothetical protein